MSGNENKLFQNWWYNRKGIRYNSLKSRFVYEKIAFEFQLDSSARKESIRGHVGNNTGCLCVTVSTVSATLSLYPRISLKYLKLCFSTLESNRNSKSIFSKIKYNLNNIILYFRTPCNEMLNRHMTKLVHFYPHTIMFSSTLHL